MENIDNIRQLLDAMSEAAIAVAEGKVIYQNAASLELVGEAGGEEFRMLFPLGLPEELEESGVALAAPGRRRLFLRAAAYGGVKVYLLRRAPERWDAPMDPPLLYGLRTQLTNIKMAADRLSEAALESREEETLEVSSMLQHSCSQMTRLLQNAETILELEQGFPPQDAASIMNTAPVDLSALCHAEMEGLSYFMREHRIDMSLDCPQADILVGLTIRQCWVVVGNLLLNSLQHLPDGGSLRLRLRRENGCATLSIDDNGDGVSLEALGRLFGAEKKEPGQGLKLVTAAAARCAARSPSARIARSRSPSEPTASKSTSWLWRGSTVPSMRMNLPGSMYLRRTASSCAPPGVSCGTRAARGITTSMRPGSIRNRSDSSARASRLTVMSRLAERSARR